MGTLGGFSAEELCSLLLLCVVSSLQVTRLFRLWGQDCYTKGSKTLNGPGSRHLQHACRNSCVSSKDRLGVEAQRRDWSLLSCPASDPPRCLGRMGQQRGQPERHWSLLCSIF